MSTVITRVELRYEQDVVYARYRARIIAEQLGFDKGDQTRISTAVSEIARNVFQYTGGGEVEFLIDTGREPGVFTITVRDHGKGIVRLDEILEGRSAPETMGQGIIVAKRLMDHFRIDTRPDGTTVVLGKDLPLTAQTVTPAVLTRIAEVLVKTATRNPFDEIRLQNQDLMHSLEELRPLQQELASVNRELDETNRGVVALYVELDDKAVSLARANAALAISEDRFQRAISVTLEGLWEWDLLSGQEYFSPRWCEILGYSPEDPALLHSFKAWTERIHPDDAERVTNALISHLKNGTKYAVDYRHRHKSGEYRWQNIKGQAVFDENKKPVKMIGVITDITDRKRAEATLSEIATLLSDVSEMAHVGGWDLDVATQEIHWTKETYLIHEIAEDAKINLVKSLLFYDLPGRSTMEAAVLRCMEKEEPFDLDLPFTSATGRHLWVRAMGRAVNVGGRVVKLTGTLQNITERKAAAEAMRTFSEDLERKVIERTSDLSDSNMKLMAEIGIRLDAEKQLSKTVGEKEVLLREVHHRVKNNLQIIVSLLNLQSRYITDEAVLLAFKDSQNRVQVMAMVHEKLYQSEDLAKIDLNNYIKFLANSLLQSFSVKGTGITLTIDIRDISLAIDTAIPLGLIINELISNSLKYGFSKGKTGEIFVAIHREDQTLTILYKDNGIGIAENFDWRTAKSMGLRLVILLVDQLNGTIELDRHAGTAFTIVVKEKM